MLQTGNRTRFTYSHEKFVRINPSIFSNFAIFQFFAALNECENKQCGDLCSEGVCDGDGFCVSPEFNPCSVYACDGKKCGETCLFNATRQGVCNKDLECDFDVNSVLSSGQCGI